jgi:hypothetical protein
MIAHMGRRTASNAMKNRTRLSDRNTSVDAPCTARRSEVRVGDASRPAEPGTPNPAEATVSAVAPGTPLTWLVAGKGPPVATLAGAT